MDICWLRVGRHGELPDHGVLLLHLVPGDASVQEIQVVVMGTCDLRDIADGTDGNCPLDIIIKVVKVFLDFNNFGRRIKCDP